MKKLQNNFTTPDQSKRLLELGLPEDSADCYYDWYGMKMEPHPYKVVSVFNGDDTFTILKDRFKRELLPCWSVGRLIEIFELCSGVLWQDTAQPSVKQPTLIERVIDTIVLFNKHGHMDFSKLED